MKKTILILILLSSTIFAVNAENVFISKCSSCHALKGMDEDMKAPSMAMISMRLKMMLDSREDFVVFVNDYIQNPSQEKGLCMPMAFKRFGTMPPIGKSLSAQERDSVAQWLYDNFQVKWGTSQDAKSCQNKNMKCGSKKSAPSKCGAVKIPTH